MNLSKARLTALGGSLALLVLVLLGWFFVLSPQMSKAGEIKEQTASVEASNTKLMAQIKAAQEQEANLGEARSYAAALGARFPQTAAQADMFAQIKDAAARAGIPEKNVTALTPTVPQGGGPAGTATGGATVPQAGAAKGVATLQVSLTVSGTQPQLIKFLTMLESMPRSYLIDTLSVGPSGESAKMYTLSINGTMFALQAPIDPATVKTAQPGVPAPTPTMTAGPGAPTISPTASEPVPAPSATTAAP